ncbi:MAG: heat shock protein Hsp20, family protein [Candidatus Paceibacter sp.]|jgi:HSP20 family protein|nr:heat shock protein Hsp20, family protein [Candidatus Paceibacter sp.]
MPKDKRSFFERLTGTVRIDDEDNELDFEEHQKHPGSPARKISTDKEPSRPDEWMEESAEEGQLTVDVFNTANDIVIKTIVAGVKPEDLDISISRDMVTVRGKREEVREVSDDDYFHRELYWGTFSRTILLPEEIDVESAEASEKHGLLTIRLPKIDKRRQTKLRVKSGM